MKHVWFVVTSLINVTTGVEQASLAITDPIIGTGTRLAHCTVTGAGQVMVGGVISCTTMVRLQVAVLPQSSVAVHVLVAEYVPGHVPGVEASLNVIVTVWSHASVAVGATQTGTAGQLIGVV